MQLALKSRLLLLSFLSLFVSILFFNGFNFSAPGSYISSEDTLVYPGEKHFANIRQLTFGGENAEAYFSLDGTKLSYQTTHGDYKCDQIFKMNTDGTMQGLVSTGTGKTTCAYYLPDNKSILFASTHHYDVNCPPKPDYSKGYVWPIHETFDIFSANEDGTGIKQLTTEKGYDAEATVSLKGDKVVFTSTRSGDLEIYTMNIDGSDVKQLTHEVGYDGGPFFSADGSKIVYRRTRFKDDKEIEDYKKLLTEGLIRPTSLEIWVMDADGGNKKQITDNSAANFAPYFFPDGNRILFCSNIEDPKGRDFDIYKINLDGTGLEKITKYPDFDGFPIFSPDGKKLVFCSNRNGKERGETNVFICDWVE